MHQRADSLVAAAKVMLFLNTTALKASAVATVGVLNLDRPSPNTVPGEAAFTVDLRHPSESVLDKLESGFRGFVDELTVQNPMIRVDTAKIWHSPAVKMDPEAVSCVRRAVEKVVGADEAIDLISLAGHDSALTATRVPTSMIFVPSKDGISHAPEEYTSEEQW
jgi:acetylornithine deacetylase/succinyl-diaminopimelate desuccinylase-like protein